MDISRRQFFRLRPADVLRETRRPPEESLPAPIRPPGALRPETTFVSACTAASGCNACIEACPYDVIKALGPAWGDAEGTPYLEPATEPCRWCPSLDCIEACDSGALAKPETGPVPRIATLTLNLDECLNRQGTICSDCSDFCPTTVRAMTSRGREPILNPETCVGCGLCVFHCDAPGPALTLK